MSDCLLCTHLNFDGVEEISCARNLAQRFIKTTKGGVQSIQVSSLDLYFEPVIKCTEYSDILARCSHDRTRDYIKPISRILYG